MVYDKERELYICEICGLETKSFWKLQWDYFKHGLRKDSFPEENESKDQEVIEKRIGNSGKPYKREKGKEGTSIDYTLIAYVIILILLVAWLMTQ